MFTLLLSFLLIDFFSQFFLFISLIALLQHFSFLFQASLNPIVAQPFFVLQHQICFVLLRFDVCEIRQLRLHYVLHKHLLQHHVFHSSQSSLGCPRVCRLTVDMIHENHITSQFLQEVFRHSSFGNSSRSRRILLLQQNSSSLFAVFVTML